MDIFNVFTLLGGLAFFLYGMNVMSAGLEKMTGGKLERALNKLTSNPAKGFMLGAGITVAIQSSSALTVMLVGLVNSGVMVFSRTVSIIMGSNVGTTLTAWILSLAGIDSESFLLRMLKPTSFSPIVALVGIIMIMLSKHSRKKDIGTILVGFSVLMFGMTLMGDAMEPLSQSPDFAGILTAFNNPLVGVLVGTIFTGIIQSSAASVGILQALSRTGQVSFAMAVPIIMGQNIGTCVTSLISSIGVSKNAKRVAALHISFNIIGTAFCLLVYMLGVNLLNITLPPVISPVGVALVHTLFNVITTALLLPFQGLLVKLAQKLVPGEDKGKELLFVDERLLNTPSFAVSECNRVTCEMAQLSVRTIHRAMKLTDSFSTREFDSVFDDEDTLDKYEDHLGSYLVKLSSRNLTDADSMQISKLLHCIGDLERIGDHSVNIAQAAEEISTKKIIFSPEAQHEISVLRAALCEILEITCRAFQDNDPVEAYKVEPLEQTIDDLILTIKTNHITRLQSGSCTIELGFILSDLLTNYERVSDHCSNIAVAIIECAHNSFAAHEYMQTIKAADNRSFLDSYEEYKKKYSV